MAVDERRFRALLEHIEIIAVMLDTRGCVTFANDYALSVLGYHSDELIGRSWFEMCVPPSEREVASRSFFDHIRAGDIAPRDQSSIMNRRGDTLRVGFANTVLRDDTGAIVGTASLGVELESPERRAESERGEDRELRAAIDEDQLVLEYQPIVHLETGAVTGFEALARWQHPQRGLLGPAELIPRAERTGLIRDIGAALLERACRQLVEWSALPGSSEAVHVSVNLSPRQLDDARLVERVDDILARTGADPARLTLEVTESILLADPDRAVALTQQLRDRALRISLDDFGTGYSSLSYLVRMPSDVLKLDRSFVSRLGSHPHDDQIAEAIVALGTGLGKEVVAEGIELESQRRALMAFGCQRGQGYLFSRPLAPDDATAMVAAARATTRIGALTR
jgi:PAS domain S-box-containing protein